MFRRKTIPAGSKRYEKEVALLTDSHSHLESLSDPHAAVERARTAGVGRIVTVSEHLPSMQGNLALAGEGILVGLGLHPQYVTQLTGAEVEEALAFLEAHGTKAQVVGEIGLDFFYATTPEQQLFQRQILERQLALAARWGRPVNLHSRRCQRQMAEVAIAFTRDTGLGAQLHWFTHSAKLLRLTNEAGVFVSVGPAILIDEAQRQVAAAVDPALLLLETDCPVAFGDLPAEPATVARVAETVASLWGCPVEEVEARTDANFHRYARTSVLGGIPQESS